jgi:DNA repair protein RecO (recombination protein O)
MSVTTARSSDGFVLHRYPYKETSLIVETFTRAYGRVAMVAKGAKRNGTNKFALNLFQPISLDWFGRADMKTLRAAEHQRIFPQIRGSALMAAFYVNELVLKLAAKDDAHEALFDAYVDTIAALSETTPANGLKAVEVSLRRFELKLLDELGYGLTLAHEADSDAPIQPHLDYLYAVERGPIRFTPQSNPPHGHMELVRVSGQTILALAAADLQDASVLLQAKLLMRRVINHHLGDKALHTRQLMRDMK